MGSIISCGTTVTKDDQTDVKTITRQLEIRNKFLGTRRAQIFMSLNDAKKQGDMEGARRLFAEYKSLGAQLSKIGSCIAMYRSAKDASDTTILLSSVKEHLESAQESNMGLPDPDTIFDIQGVLETGADALRDTNEALSSEWQLNPFTSEESTLEHEFQEFLGSHGDPGQPHGLESPLLSKTSTVPTKQSQLEQNQTPTETKTSTTMVEPSFVDHSPQLTRKAVEEQDFSSISPNMDLKPQEKPLLLAS